MLINCKIIYSGSFGVPSFSAHSYVIKMLFGFDLLSVCAVVGWSNRMNIALRVCRTRWMPPTANCSNWAAFVNRWLINSMPWAATCSVCRRPTQVFRKTEIVSRTRKKMWFEISKDRTRRRIDGQIHEDSLLFWCYSISPRPRYLLRQPVMITWLWLTHASWCVWKLLVHHCIDWNTLFANCLFQSSHGRTGWGSSFEVQRRFGDFEGNACKASTPKRRYWWRKTRSW